ncbi:uncharacterized protein [Blastocystis hominis]|uniref:OBG-type G domain-containing protein n=1 Tax=Blastocystis hominis TaxID=12968 RepID=D8LXK1_BLAHO|nr:uncharacterized protein [Blastocystis hominis]XP_012899225.1 uncharacterized protein [Blastocystis hominis]CBK20306.2 unnamed protein product [Blastocystis hominis]CBK25177.2 unnamed protein product [Blastocystis hominis]|eukprot:XP_012894354.1 uncharacterized protein [Blastocystis hominis]
MGIIEKIKEIEAEMARTQKNKATEFHFGVMKARLAKLRSELLDPSSGGGSGGKGDGFEVARVGDARVALIGFPSVGKSSLLSHLTDTKSEEAAYEFTTLTCIPGNVYYKGCRIQLLDLPGIIEGAAYGRGRGRQVIAVAKSADLILMVLDAGKEEEKNHREILERELETVGLRLNKEPPRIYFKVKNAGGIKFNATVKLTQLGDDPYDTVYKILHEYRIHNAEVIFRDDYGVDELIDVIEGNRKYVKCLYVYNKIDTVCIEDVDRLARLPHSTVCSIRLNLNVDTVLELIWEYMGLLRIYTKRRAEPPSFDEPVVLSKYRNGLTVEGAVAQISQDLLEKFNYALVWGTSTKYSPQHCGLAHVLEDEDVIQIVKKTVNQEKHDKNYSQQCQAVYDKYKKKKKSGKSS